MDPSDLDGGLDKLCSERQLLPHACARTARDPRKDKNGARPWGARNVNPSQ